MFRKIGWELTISYILLIVFSMAILGTFLLNFVESYFKDNAHQELYRQAQLVAEGWPRSMSLNEPDLRQMRFYWDLIDRISRQTGSRIRILNDSGVCILDSGGEQELDLCLRDEIKVALEGRAAEGKPAGIITQAYPIMDSNESGTSHNVMGIVYITRSQTYVKTILYYLRGQFYLAFSISLALSIALAFFFSHYITKPIVDITKQADLISKGHLEERAKINARNEIGVLSERFNLMAEKLQGTLGQLTGEKNKLAAILNNMAGGVIVIDESGKIILINKTAIRLLGLRDLDVMGNRIHTILPGHSLLRLIEDSEMQTEVHARLEDIPDERTVDAHFTPLLPDDENIIGAVIILTDVTEFRRLDKMRTEFVSNVSHELKTPLASIKGLSELLIDGALTDDEEKAVEFLKSINREVDRLTRLVKDLLDLSKMESGMVRIDTHPINMEDTAKQVISRMTPQATRKNIEVIDELDCMIPALANLDRVQQVMINLIDNAIRYTPSGEKIFVRLKQKDEKYCIVEVEDTGPGISPENLERIFERFFRVDRSRSREEGGFGLGLAITRQIVENLGGTIGVNSTPDKGTTFYFTLPLVKVI